MEKRTPTARKASKKDQRRTSKVKTLSSVGATIPNEHLHTEAQRRAQEIATMAEIGRDILATLDLSTVLQRIASRAMDLFRAHDVVLRLLESDGRLPAAAAIGKFADIYKNWDAQLGHGLSGSVAQSGVAEIINDPENDLRVIAIAGTEQDKAVRAILFAPLLIGETVIGVLSVWRDRTTVGPFTQADLDFAVSLARQAAIAIQNARLFAASQQRFAETEILRAANVALTKTLDLDDILGTLLEYLQQVVPYDTGSVFLLESETRLTARAARGYEHWTENPAQATSISFEFETLPHIRAVVEDQTTVIIPDVTQYPHWIVAPTAKHVRNWLAVPLVAGGKTIGMYSLDKAEPGFFTPEHQRLSENLAAQAAIAMENANLFHNQRVAREQAETLQAVTQALSRTLSLQEVFELILTELQKVVPYDSCSVQQLEGEYLIIVGGHGFPNLDELIGLQFQITSGDLSSYVISTRQPHLVEDVSVSFPHFKNREHGTGRIRGWLGVPLIFGDRLIGMLALDKHEKAFYTPEHAQLAMAFAAQAAVAIENARLFETERAARQQAEAQTRQMAALNRVAQSVTSTVDLQSVLETAAREMAILINARSVGIGLLNEKRSEVRVVSYYSQADEPSAVGLIIPVEGNLATQKVIETGQSILIADAQNTPLQNEATRAVMRVRNTHCILLLPLLARGEVIGTIGPDTDQPDRVFTPEEVQLAQTIANQLAGVIENARLFDETQRLLKETEERNAELAIINSVQAALAAKLDMQGIYNAIGDKIRDIFDAQKVMIVTYDKSSNLMSYPYLTEKGKRITSEPLLRDGTGVMDYVISEKRSIMINTDFAQRTMEITGIEPVLVGDEHSSKSRLDVPMIVGGEACGGISLQNVDREKAFSEADMRLLQTLANSMGVALENARLFDETQRLLKETEQRAAELAIINSIGQTLTEQLDLNSMVEHVGDKLYAALQVKNIGIGIYNEKENIMQVPYICRDGERLTVQPFALNGFNRRVSKAGRSLVVNKDAEKLWLKFGGISVGDEIPKSFVMVPLMAGKELVGGISLQDFDHENAFADLSIGLLETIASNMGTAILNARLFEETQQRNAELAILNDLGKSMATTLDIKVITRNVGDIVREIFKAEITDILLYDPASNMVQLTYSYSNGYFDDEPPWELGEGGLTTKIILSRQPLLLDSAQEMEQQGAVAYVTTPTGEPDPQSYLGVPIMVGDRVLGVVDVQSLRADAFDENNLRLLQTLSSNMGVALENARLFDETQRLLKETEQRAAELAAISTVSQALVVETELDSMIQLIGSQTREIFDADIVYVALLDPQTNLIHFPYQIGESFVALQFGEGMTSRIIQTGEPLLINQNVMEHIREIGIQNVGREVLSYLGVPIKAGGETIGVISVQSTTEEGLFNDDSLRLLTTIAASVGAAIHTARLHTETQRNASQMATIASVGSDLSATLDLQKVIRTVVENVHNLFQATDTVLRLVDSDGKSLRAALALGNYAEEHSADVILLGQGITGSIAQSGIAEVIENVGVDPRGVHVAGTPDQDEIPQTMMVAPLIAGNHTIGVISVYKDRPTGIFSPVDLDFLMGLGRQAAFAIQNATLFRNQLVAREQAETLQAVTQALSRTLSLEEVFDLILSELQKVVPYNSCSVQQWDGAYSVIVGGRGFPNIQELRGLRFPTVEGDLSSYVLKGRQPYILENVSASYPYFKNPEFGGGVIHGWMGVPLIFGDRVIGMLTLDKHEEAFYTSEHAQLAMAFAAQAAVAIENARLFDTERLARQQAEVQSRHMATIASVGRDLSATLDLQKVIRTVVENVHDLFQARDTILRMVDADGKTLSTALALGKYDKAFAADIIILGEGITGGIAQSGIAEVIENLELDPRRVQVPGTPDHYETPQTLMVAPLIASNRTIGVMAVYKDRTQGSFSQEDLDFLVGLGRQAAIAIENSRLFDETQRLLNQTEQRATELQIINHIGITLTEGLDLDSTLERVAKRLHETLHVDNIGITIADPNIDIIIAQYFHSNCSSFAADRFSFGKYRLGIRMSMKGMGRSWVVNTNVEKSWRKYAGDFFEGDSVPKSFILLPLLVGKDAIGGITIADFENENAFDEVSTNMLETLAANMGTAIQNARLFEETQRLFEDAQDARAAAEQANKAKSTFLANMSHELRTPLNAIIGFTRIVKKKAEGTLPEKQIENLEKVLSSSEHLLGLINTVLDIAKIEAGRMDVIPAKFNMSMLTDQCANLATPLLKPNVRLEKQVDEAIGMIFSDQDKIKQIVLNLLSNAAKFTHDGRILLSVQKHNEDIVSISVTDSGIGISEEALDRIFEEFQQADTSTTREYGGTGLGLAISRNLALLLGGDLTATSELGKGSTFTLTIPTYYGRKPASQLDDKPASVQESDPQPKQDAAKHRILVIDDDPDALYLLQEGLGTSEFDVVGARNGHTGLQIARDQQPEAILLDILMPETDGWQILNDLKSDATTANIPVILLTIVDKKALGFKLGAADYLLKPLNPTVVLDVLRRIIGEKGPMRKCALVVDDDPHVAEMLRQTLPESEFALISAEDGEAGLEMIKVQHPDIILLDLVMPRLDGFGVIEGVRADPELRNIPIIVISSKDLTPDESKRLRESVAFVMKKQGFNGDRLIQEINSVVKR